MYYSALMFKTKIKTPNSREQFEEANGFRNGPSSWYQIKIKAADGATLMTVDALLTAPAAALFKTLSEEATLTIEHRVESYEPV